MYVEGLGAWRFKSGGARDEGNGFAENWREEEADMEAIFASFLFFQLDKVLFWPFERKYFYFKNMHNL